MPTKKRKEEGPTPPKPNSRQTAPGDLALTEHQSFTIKRIRRSQIKLAEYNPRYLSEEADDALKRSLKYFGLIETVVWNEQTGTLVGGHQRLKRLDKMEDYPNHDYLLDVAAVDFDEKKEIEANIALNNPNLQGEFDFQALANFQGQIDFGNAGYNKADQDYFASLRFENTMENKSVEDIIDTFEEMKQHTKELKAQTEPDDYLERKAAAQAVKQSTYSQVKESTEYITILLPSTAAKNALLTYFGQPLDNKYLSAADLFEKLGIDLPTNVTPPDTGNDEESALAEDDPSDQD